MKTHQFKGTQRFIFIGEKENITFCLLTWIFWTCWRFFHQEKKKIKDFVHHLVELKWSILSFFFFPKIRNNFYCLSKTFSQSRDIVQVVGWPEYDCLCWHTHWYCVFFSYLLITLKAWEGWVKTPLLPPVRAAVWRRWLSTTGKDLLFNFFVCKDWLFPCYALKRIACIFRKEVQCAGAAK